MAIDRWFMWAIGLVVALIMAMVVDYQNTRTLNEQGRLVAHTYDVMAGLEDVLSSATDAETGQRGYLITAEPRYLIPYDAALSTVSQRADELERLIADDPDQQARVPKLREHLSAKLKELDETIKLRQNGNMDAAREVVLSDRGKKQMDALRGVVTEMIAHERDLLQKRSEQAEQSYRTAIVTGIFTSLTSVIGVVAYGILWRRHHAKRHRDASVIAEQAERLRTTLASIGDAVITTDTQGRVTNLNPVAASLTGWLSNEALGQRLDVVFNIVNEQSRSRVENPAIRALREGVIVGLANHTVLIAKDATERPIDDSAAPIRCKVGEIVGCVLVFHDISERRKAEFKLRESEARKSAILDTALDCIISIDLNGKIVDFNPAAEQTFGYRRDDVIGQKMCDLIVPVHLREAHRSGLARLLTTGESRILGRRIQLTAQRSNGGQCECWSANVHWLLARNHRTAKGTGSRTTPRSDCRVFGRCHH